MCLKRRFKKRASELSPDGNGAVTDMLQNIWKTHLVLQTTTRLLRFSSLLRPRSPAGPADAAPCLDTQSAAASHPGAQQQQHVSTSVTSLSLLLRGLTHTCWISSPGYSGNGSRVRRISRSAWRSLA